MDSSLQSANLTVDEHSPSMVAEHEDTHGAEQHHIHLPNPSWWPLMLSVAILVAVAGLLFIPDSPWLLIIAAPFILFGIMGWALEDPMAPPSAQLVSSQAAGAPSKYAIGQDVVDNEGNWLGVVQANFARYSLVDNGEIFLQAFYVPHRFIQEPIQGGPLRLNVSKADLLEKGLHRVPNDLYEETPDFGVPQINGTPMFARRPLSPAETGHYHYGPNFPGINTDASGSYRPVEVRPVPQRYVGDRRKIYTARKSVPARAASAS